MQPAIDLSCSKCKSKNIQRLSLVFLSSLNNTQTESTILGAGIGPASFGVRVRVPDPPPTFKRYKKEKK